MAGWFLAGWLSCEDFFFLHARLDVLRSALRVLVMNKPGTMCILVWTQLHTARSGAPRSFCKRIPVDTKNPVRTFPAEPNPPVSPGRIGHSTRQPTRQPAPRPTSRPTTAQPSTAGASPKHQLRHHDVLTFFLPYPSVPYIENV